MTSVDARALADTFAGADADRPFDPALVAESPALPAGADPTDSDAVTAAATDQGPRILEVLRERLGAQPEWTVDGDRGFTWWSGRLATTVVAGPPTVLHGLSVVRVTTTTPLLRDVPASPDLARRLAAANAQAAIDGLVWDPDARTVSLVSDAWCHAGNAWLDPLVYSAAGLQPAIGDATVDALRADLGGEVAASAHPTGGPREEPDELIEAGAAFAAAGDRSTPFTEGDLRALGRSPLGLLPFAVHGSDTLTAEMPYGAEATIPADRARPDRVRDLVGAARRDRTTPPAAHEAEWLAATPATAFFRVSFGERHPEFGAGLAMRLRIPVRAADEGAAADLAALLDRREVADRKLAPFVGAWTIDGAAPIFVSFFPVPLARGLGSDDRGAILDTFAAWTRDRARWAAGVVGTDGTR
jgi:hypothetical protein